MTGRSGDGVDSDDGFKDRVLEVLMRLRTEDPPTDETVLMAAEVAAAAEGRDKPYWIITMKYFHLSALQGAGRIDEAMVEFPKLLAYCDGHPGEDKGNLLLTVYKWMVYNARLFPQVSKGRIEGLMRDFEGRMRREGVSLRPLHQARMNWAMARGRAEEAARHFRDWQAAARDGVSDCSACELNDRVEYLAFLGHDGPAVGAAGPLLAGELKCNSVPDRTYGALLAPLLRLGRREEALDTHGQGIGRIEGKMRYVDAAAEHVTFLVKAGEMDEASRVFQSFLPLALEDTTPFKRFKFLLAGWLLLDRMRAAGSGGAGLDLPASFDAHRRRGVYDLESLAGWFRAKTLELAEAFDARDETDAYSRRVTAAFDTEMPAPAQARARAAEAPSAFPPESWFAASAGGALKHVAFRDTKGDTELVGAEWEEENLFRVLEHPLRVDGVARDDLVEVRWEGADPTPRFTGVRERSGRRTVRVLASEAQIRSFLSWLQKFRLLHYVGDYRYEDGVFVFCIHPKELEVFAGEEGVTLQEMLPGVWAFTDAE